MSRTPPIAAVQALGPLRVLVVAGDPLVRAALARALEDESESPVRVVDDATDAEVALWDAGSGGAAADLPDGLPALALVDDARGSATALSSGARGAVLRSADGASLWAGLVAVHHGLTVLDGAFAPPRAPAAPRTAGVDELTGREREVLALLARGLSNPQIAARLSISEHTAKFHAGQILAKLGAATRTEAVVIAARRGLVTL